MGNLLAKAVVAAITASFIIQSIPSVSAPETVTAVEQKSYLYGDLDGDEKLTSFDLIKMRQGAVDSSKLDETQTVISDLNADGKLDGEDLTLLQDFLLGKDVTFPAGVWYTPNEEYNGQKTLSGRTFV